MQPREDAADLSRDAALFASKVRRGYNVACRRPALFYFVAVCV